jgi:hypothetical protein
MYEFGSPSPCGGRFVNAASDELIGNASAKALEFKRVGETNCF